MINTVRLKSKCGRWFTVPEEVYHSLYANSLFVECNKCGTFHQIKQLRTKEGSQ